MNTRLNRNVILSLCCSVLFFLILREEYLLIGDFRVDDAYISFSFARNLSLGHGLTYAHSQLVEGYSNFFWVIILSFFQWIMPSVDLIVPARMVSYASLSVLALLVFFTIRRKCGKTWGLIGVALLAAWSDMTRAALSGMETIFFTTVLFGALYAYHIRKLKLFSCFLSLALLTRFDGIVFSSFFILHALVFRRKTSHSVITFARSLAFPLLVWALYFAWRYSYYGVPLPLPFYAKTSNQIFNLYTGGTSTLNFVFANGLLLFFAFYITFLREKFKEPSHVFTGFVCFVFIYNTIVGGDWMPFHRFLIPAIPALIILFIFAMESGTKQISRLSLYWLKAATFIPLGAGLLSAFVLVDAHYLNTESEKRVHRNAKVEGRHIQSLLRAVPHIRSMLRQPTQKLATDYGGVFGYLTDAYIIEMWGLCNKEIALQGSVSGINPKFGKTCLGCYRGFDPDFFHVGEPLLRPPNSFTNKKELLAEIFQANALDRYLNFTKNFIVGTIRVKDSSETLFFLERKSPELAYVPRTVSDQFLVEYPLLK